MNGLACNVIFIPHPLLFDFSLQAAAVKARGEQRAFLKHTHDVLFPTYRQRLVLETLGSKYFVPYDEFLHSNLLKVIFVKSGARKRLIDQEESRFESVGSDEGGESDYISQCDREDGDIEDDEVDEEEEMMKFEEMKKQTEMSTKLDDEQLHSMDESCRQVRENIEQVGNDVGRGLIDSNRRETLGDKKVEKYEHRVELLEEHEENQLDLLGGDLTEVCYWCLYI